MRSKYVSLLPLEMFRHDTMLLGALVVFITIHIAAERQFERERAFIDVLEL